MEVAQNWYVNASAVYQHGKQMNSSGGKYVPFDVASPLSAVLGVKWEQPQYGLTTHLLGTFSRGISRVSDETYYKPGGYAVFDGYVNWQIDKTYRLSAGLTNIFNKRYFEYSAGGVYADSPSVATNYTAPLELYTAPGRTVSVNFSASF